MKPEDLGTPDTSTATATLAITNKRGLHARASANLVRLVEGFQSRVTVSKDGVSVGGTSIMGLMLLAAGPGSHISVEAEGTDAQMAVAAITKLVEDRFGEGE